MANFDIYDDEFDIRELLSSRTQNFLTSYYNMGWKAKLGQKIFAEELTYHTEENFVYEDISTEDISGWLEEISGNMVVPYETDKFYIHDDDYVIEIRTTERNIFTTVNPHIMASSESRGDEVVENLKSVFPKPLQNSHVRFDWYFINGGDLDSIQFDDFIDDEFHEEAYPYFRNEKYEGIDDWVERYLDSSSPLAFFFGPPGTGKTRFLRFVARKGCESSKFSSRPRVMYISGPKTVSLEAVFIKFLKGSYDFLIIEDLDEKIKPRKDGNESMTTLLTTSDGVVSSLNKKIMITSNIPSLGQHDIDPALLRAGRCFDFKEFEKLDVNQSGELLNKIGGDQNELERSETYPISDLYYLSEHGKLPKKQEEVEGTGFMS